MHAAAKPALRRSTQLLFSSVVQHVCTSVWQRRTIRTPTLRLTSRVVRSRSLHSNMSSKLHHPNGAPFHAASTDIFPSPFSLAHFHRSAVPPNQRKGPRPARRVVHRTVQTSAGGAPVHPVAGADVPTTERPKRGVRPGRWRELGGRRAGRLSWTLSKSSRRRSREGRRPTLVYRRWQR